MSDTSLEELLALYIEHHERTGERLPVRDLKDGTWTEGDAGLLEALNAHVDRYHEIESTLTLPHPAPAVPLVPVDTDAELPTFAGFRTVERLGQGGMGTVYKLEDLRLGRAVAAKVLRGGERLAYGDFLREARALALFEDPGVVRIHEYREASGGEPAVILMEHVEGFELGRLAASLEPRQRARIVADVCETVHRAHRRGIQHRDLKPNNILLDDKLRPRIVDFGLASGDPAHGHGVGTPAYMAPEQLRPMQPIDDRVDVYALGAVLYELLCGEAPPSVLDDAPVRLPKEIDPDVPEPLQAIALKALEEEPAARYASAREMARDLRRYLEGKPVLARPSLYGDVLERRMRPHLDEIREWLALKLLYTHEAERLRGEYRRLRAREEDWIVESRRLTLAQITLYLGGWLLLCGALFYTAVHRLHETAAPGLREPLLVLGLPFAVLTAGAFLLERRERRAAAVACFLAAALVLPFLLLLLLHEAAFWPAGEGDFLGSVSNRELQVAVGLGCAFAVVLALRTRTVGLASVFTVWAVVFALAVHTDLGLETWIEEGRWDLLAFHLAPLVLLMGLLGFDMERHGRRHLALPLYLGAEVLLLAVLELLALDGRAFAYLGISLDAYQDAEKIADPLLLPTLAAMTVNGVLLYAVGALAESRGSELRRQAAGPLLVLAPFLTLEPIFTLNTTDEYAAAFLWAYLVLALAVALVSRHRQRKSFYYAGLLNTGLALYLVAERYEWLDSTPFAAGVVTAGLLSVLLGIVADHLQRTRGPS